MRWLFGKTEKSHEEQRLLKLDISEIDRWYENVIGRQKASALQTCRAAHKAVVDSFLALERALSDAIPKQVQDRHVAQIVARERQNIIKKARSTITSYSTRPVQQSRAGFEQLYREGCAVLAQLLSPKQSWLLSKYFELDSQPFKVAEAALAKFGRTLSGSNLAIFDQLDMVVKELASTRKVFLRHTENMSTAKAKADQIRHDMAALAAELDQLRNSKKWQAAQHVLDQAAQARTEANHIRAIITSKMAAIQKIAQKGKAGLTPEQLAHIDRIRTEIDSLQVRLAEIVEPTLPDIVIKEAELVERVNSHKTRLVELETVLKRLSGEIKKTEQAIGLSIKTLERLADQVGQRIAICQ